MGEVGIAEDALTEANIKDNDNSVVWLALTLFALKKGRRLQAEQTFREAMTSPKLRANPDLFESLGDEFSNLTNINDVYIERAQNM